MSSPLHVIFCGTPDFAVPSLIALAENPAFAVDLVITQPDKPVGRQGIVTSPAVKLEAMKRGIPIFQPRSLNKEWKEKNITPPDFLVAVAYGQILNKDVLALPKIAPINVHASLLPRHRGASPIQHAILAGDKTSGVTIQRMVESLDAGPILSQASVQLTPTMTSPELSEILSVKGADLLASTLLHPLSETPQNEKDATHCKKLSRADSVVDPTKMIAEEIDRRVRALVPWPGVTIGDVKILKTSLGPIEDAYALECAQKTMLYLSMVQPAGKKPMTGASWARGRKADRLS